MDLDLDLDFFFIEKCLKSNDWIFQGCQSSSTTGKRNSSLIWNSRHLNERKPKAVDEDVASVGVKDEEAEAPDQDVSCSDSSDSEEMEKEDYEKCNPILSIPLARISVIQFQFREII